MNIFQHIVDQVPEAIIFADNDGNIVSWNGGAEKIFGFTASEAIGQSLDLIVPEKLRAAHWRGFNAAIKAGKTKHAGEVRITRSLHKSGKRLYVSMSFAIIRDEDQKTIGSAAVARDVTEEYLQRKGQTEERP